MSKAAGQRNGNQRKKDTAATRDKKEQLYAAGRKEAEAVVEEGIAFIEDARARVAALRSQQMSLEKHLAAVEPLLEAQESAFEELISLYPPMLEDLGPRRAEQLNSASKMNQTNSSRREASYVKISRETRRQLEETKQKATDATDAKELIEKLKAVIRIK